MRKFKQKIKEFLEEHFGWFLVIVLLVFCIISIPITFICVKPMSDEQIVYCQEVAKDIYAQDSIIYEAPDNVDVTITDTSIQVGMKGVRGSVISKLQNGELVFVYTRGIYLYRCSGRHCKPLWFHYFLYAYTGGKGKKKEKRKIMARKISSIQKGPFLLKMVLFLIIFLYSV